MNSNAMEKNEYCKTHSPHLAFDRPNSRLGKATVSCNFEALLWVDRLMQPNPPAWTWDKPRCKFLKTLHCQRFFTVKVACLASSTLTHLGVKRMMERTLRLPILPSLAKGRFGKR